IPPTLGGRVAADRAAWSFGSRTGGSSPRKSPCPWGIPNGRSRSTIYASSSPSSPSPICRASGSARSSSRASAWRRCRAWTRSARCYERTERVRALFLLHARVLRDSRPPRHVRRNEGAHLVGRAHHDLGALLGEPLLGFRQLLDRRDLGVEAVQESLRRSGPKPPSPPDRRLVAGHSRLGRGRDVGEHRRAHGRLARR